MKTAVDTNALLAILYLDEHTDPSERALREAYRNGRVVITPIVAAELAADGHFEAKEELHRFLDDLRVDVESPSPDAAFVAGDAYRHYLDRRPSRLQCPSCGSTQSVGCDECGSRLAPRQHLAADFLIGAHASIDADALITFDAAFFETYFPTLSLEPS